MYNDLKKYITHDTTIEEDSVAWYFKQICERCKDQEFVKQIIQNLKASRDEILDTEFNPFASMVESYHTEDILDEENAVLKLILLCFTTDFVFFGIGNDMVDVFYDYTSRGLKARGINERNSLTEYFDSFEDFVDLFENFTDEQLKEFLYSRNTYDINAEVEEYSMASLGIILDERKEEYKNIVSLFEDLSFTEIEPGTLVYCCYSYGGEYSDYDTLTPESFEKLIECIPNVVDTLEQHNSAFNILNIESSYAFEILMRVKGNSQKEVLF